MNFSFQKETVYGAPRVLATPLSEWGRLKQSSKSGSCISPRPTAEWVTRRVGRGRGPAGAEPGVGQGRRANRGTLLGIVQLSKASDPREGERDGGRDGGRQEETTAS